MKCLIYHFLSFNLNEMNGEVGLREETEALFYYCQMCSSLTVVRLTGLCIRLHSEKIWDVFLCKLHLFMTFLFRQQFQVTHPLRSEEHWVDMFCICRVLQIKYFFQWKAVCSAQQNIQLKVTHSRKLPLWIDFMWSLEFLAYLKKCDNKSTKLDWLMWLLDIFPSHWLCKVNLIWELRHLGCSPTQQ